MSVEFEEPDSAVKEAYRKLGQGIKVFHDPPDADVDIIAVPGLGTDPVECWTYRGSSDNGDATPGEERSKRAVTKKFNWIRDEGGLAFMFPRSRIMLYDYASAWTGRFKVRASMKSICEYLLEELNEKRKDGVMRPLVFIGHSMGGIVIAKALTIARAKKEYEATLNCTMGCAFFGVPFRGSNMAQLALLYSAVFGNDAYEALLSFLRTEKNDTLDEVTDDFVELSRKVNPPMEMFCVWEQFPTAVSYTQRALKNMPALLQHRFFKTGAEKLMEVGIAALGGSTHFVSKESACLMGTHTIGLNAGHSDLVQFESIDAPKFLQIKFQLQKMMSQAKYNIRKRAVAAGQNLSSQNFIKTVQRSLEGIDMRSKYRAMTAHVQGNSWLTSEARYSEWMSYKPTAPPYLWLTGAAGLGKTNACLAALQQLEEETFNDQTASNMMQNETFLAFFLCDKVSGCNTAEELLKCLISQFIAQESSLAQHARWFVSNATTKASSRNGDLDPRAGARATATVENLWKCLQDIMEDPVVGRMHIVISNLHHLQLTESTIALLTKFSEHAQVTSGDKIKFLISSRKEQQIKKALLEGHISLIDLDDAEFGARIRAAREKHAKNAVAKLKTSKTYNTRLAWWVTSTIHDQSRDETWIDIVCILLSSKPPQTSEVEIRDWLSQIVQLNMDQLIDNAWGSVLERPDSKKFSADLEDLMRVLTITFEAPSMADLIVLTGSNDHKFIYKLVRLCAPVIRIGTEGESKDKVVFSNEEFRKRLRERCYEGHRGRGDEEKKRHGLIALSCFQHIKDYYGPLTKSAESPLLRQGSSLTRSGSVKASIKKGTIVMSTDDDDEVERLTGGTVSLDVSTSTYPTKYLFEHVRSATSGIVQDLFEEDVNFWGKQSSLRDVWLKDFRKMTSDLNDLTSEGMSALHIAAGIGAEELVSLLVEVNKRESMKWTSDDGMTALHVAAFNNQAAVVETLLRLGTDVEAGQNEIGTPLHFAALKGNAAVMQLLIAKGASVNAYSRNIGPVINAAILSGTVDAVNKIMQAEVRFDSDYTKCEPPLSLSAGHSKPELFKDILDSGRDKWLQNVKLIDRALVEAATSGHLESVKTLLEFPHTYANDTIEDAIYCAAREVNWAPALSLLDFAINDTNQGRRRHVRLEEVFYLAVAGRDERLETLEKIWTYVGRHLNRHVIDFSLYEATALRKPKTASWLLTTCYANANATSARPKPIKAEYTNVAASVDYKTTLNAAASTGNALLVDALIKQGATVDTPGCYALQLAAAEGHLDTVKVLLDRGAAINRKLPDSSELGCYSGTALQAACDNNRAAVVELLISRRADPNIGGGAFSNPITSATQRGHQDILRFLLRADNINVNVTGTEDKATPLINAAAYMDEASMRLLLEKGADIDAQNSTGDTALILAAAKGKKDCVKLLCDKGANVIHKCPSRGVPITVAADALQPDCARILADIMVQRIERYSKQEPRHKKTIAEQENELTDLRAKYSDEQDQIANLISEIESHKQNIERLTRDGTAHKQRDTTRGAEVQAIRVQLFSKENELFSVTEQFQRAEDIIREKEQLLEAEKAVNKTLRSRAGWADLMQEKQAETAKFEAEVLRTQNLTRDIEELKAAAQVALEQIRTLDAQLRATTAVVKSEKEAGQQLQTKLQGLQQQLTATEEEKLELKERLEGINAAMMSPKSSESRSPPITSAYFAKRPGVEPIDEYQVIPPVESPPAISPAINGLTNGNAPRPANPRHNRSSIGRFPATSGRFSAPVAGRYYDQTRPVDGSVGGYGPPRTVVQQRSGSDSLYSSSVNGDEEESR